MSVQNPPEGYHTVTPYLLVEGARDLLEFAKAALGATQQGEIFEDPRNGLVGHAEMQIGSSRVMFADAMEGFPPTKTLLHLYVDDVDTAYATAVEAGAEGVDDPTDQFYGDRTARVQDRWGNTWYFATHVEDVPMQEMEKRMAEALAEP